MAHFRRAKPRLRTFGNPIRWGSWPAHHDRSTHTRPKRRKICALEREVVMDRRDVDDLPWPLGNHKPHNYWD